MYQILSIHPGIVKIPNKKHGDIVEVSCAIDQKYHSSVKVMLCEIGQPHPEREDGVLLGFISTELDLFTFAYTTSHHLQIRGLDCGEHVLKPDIVIGVVDGEDIFVFEETSVRLLYHSNGDE